MNLNYYIRQLITKIEALTDEVTANGEATQDVNVTNSSVAVSNDYITRLFYQTLDKRLYGLNPDVSKITYESAYLCHSSWPAGNSTVGLNMGTTGPPLQMGSGLFHNGPSVISSASILTFPPASTNFSLPYDGTYIVAGDTTNDAATTGANARTVELVYYDSSWVKQTVTHNLGDNSTAYHIRKVISLKVNSWGANKYNASGIWLWNSVPSAYCGWISPMENNAFFNHIGIPKNGYILLDKIEANLATSNGIVRLILWKQTTSSAYSYSVIWQRNIGTSPYAFDLSYLPIIYGPTNNSESWGIVITGLATTGTTAVGVIDLKAKVYNP